jgi:hypothetical protein
MESYFGVAKEEGVTREEMQTVEAIVMAVASGQVRAQFREARARWAARRKPDAGGRGPEVAD